jgi:hypothetical protein
MALVSVSLPQLTSVGLSQPQVWALRLVELCLAFLTLGPK